MWFLIVGLCFAVAGTLITNSYSDWQESPIATSITTHPIAELDFPTITVCPPRGSHTALNLDLMKADNDSMTEKNRKYLIQKAYNRLLKVPHLDYAENLLASTPAEQLDLMYNGFQAFPKPLTYGYETKVRKMNGTIRSPFYGEDYDEKQYMTDRFYQVVLEFPDDLAEQVGDGKLVVELEVDTRVEEGWMEEVRYIKGPKYKSYKDTETPKTWREAEEHCQRQGSHLASVLTAEDWDEIGWVLEYGMYTWLGGTDVEDEGAWKNIDGTPWGFEKWWNADYGYQGLGINCTDCLKTM